MPNPDPDPDWFHIGRSGNELTVYFFGEFPAPAAAEAFFAELRGIRAKTITIFINSLGGDLFTGFAIANRIRDWQGKGARVVCEVAGIAGSAAAVIAAAADETRMPADGFLFLHNGAYVDGREDDDRLAAMNDAMARRFSLKTGREKAEVLALMAGESWVGAEEAAALGFADAIFGEM